jgi:hypothetical protein
LLKEQLGHELASAVNSDLLEDRLEVVLDGVRRHVELIRHLISRVPAQDETGHLALALRKAIRLGDEGRDLGLP